MPKKKENNKIYKKKEQTSNKNKEQTKYYSDSYPQERHCATLRVEAYQHKGSQ
jgi:hypothetical protein